MDRYLVIVARDQLELWRDLRQNYAHAEGMEIILDRRERESCQWTHPAEAQAQRAERRRLGAGADLHGNPFVVVPRP